MSKHRVEFESTLGEMRRGATKYIEPIINILEKMADEKGKASIKEAGMELVFMGYAMGVIAGKYSDMGIEGFTLLLNGIKISLNGEERKEKLMFAVYDKDEDLHTSEDAFKTKEGGSQ